MGNKKIDLHLILQELLNQTKDVFWIRTADYSKQVYINPAYQKIWGLTSESLYKSPEKWMDAIHPEDQKRLKNDIKKRNPHVLPNQKFYQHYRIIRKDGTIRWIEDESFAIFNHKTGEHLAFAGIATDVTEKKNHELFLKEAKQKAEMLKNSETELRKAIAVLGASVAHDLRTPLVSISIFLDLLNSKILSLEDRNINSKVDETSVERVHINELKDLILKIKDSTTQMNDFIATTLKTIKSTMSGEVIREDFLPCSIWNCINNTLIRYPMTLEQHKLIQWNQTDFTFMGNEIMAIRIISNLLNNSFEQIKKNLSGNIFIYSKEENDFNVLYFEDTAGGLSIPIEHLFDGYQTTKEQGHGIGLAFCRLAMKSLAGDIVVEQTSNGVIFKLLFPK